MDLFLKHWGSNTQWVNQYDGGPHEANYLKLDCSKLKTTFGWKPVWDLNEAVKRVVEWSKCWSQGEDVYKCMMNQVNDFIRLQNAH